MTANLSNTARDQAKSNQECDAGAEALRVAHVSRYASRGGAAISASILVRKLIQRGIKAEIFCLEADSKQSNVPLLGFDTSRLFRFPVKILNKLTAWRSRVVGDIYGMLDNIYYRRLTKNIPDIFHIHNIHGGWFPLRLLLQLANVAPLVWTLHDEWAITGHCAATFECARWKTGCGKCPSLATYPSLWRDVTRKNREIKVRIYRGLAKKSVVFVTPSYWLADRVRESGVWPGVVKVIPNAIETEIFCPTDKYKAREKLSLPQDARILLFSANLGAKNQFKNFALYENTLRLLPKGGGFLGIALGGQSSQPAGMLGGCRFMSPGYVADKHQLSLYYSAADLLVYPTKADSFGLVVTEAMACGTPVIATRVGGVAEQVVNGVTGVLVEPDISAEALASEITRLLQSPGKLNEMRHNSRRRAELLYSDARMANDYENLYRYLLNWHKGSYVQDGNL